MKASRNVAGTHLPSTILIRDRKTTTGVHPPLQEEVLMLDAREFVAHFMSRYGMTLADAQHELELAEKDRTLKKEFDRVTKKTAATIPPLFCLCPW
jgi:hypothetical protein